MKKQIGNLTLLNHQKQNHQIILMMMMIIRKIQLDQPKENKQW